MIDIGFNLMMRAMMKRKSIVGLDRLIQQEIGGGDPYLALRAENADDLIPHKKALKKLASLVGASVEKVLWKQDKTFANLYPIIAGHSEASLSLDGTVIIDHDNTCTAELGITVRTSKSSRMSIVCRLGHFAQDGCIVGYVKICFWAGGKTIDFLIDPKYIGAKSLTKPLEKNRDYKLLLKGCELFLGGIGDFEAHLRRIWGEGTAPWTAAYKSDDDAETASNCDLYLSPQEALYKAAFPKETYSIRYKAEIPHSWSVESVWNGKFKYSIRWETFDDLALRILVQNGYMFYDTLLAAMKLATDKADSDAGHLENSSTAVANEQLKPAAKPITQTTKPRKNERPVEKVHVNDLVVRSTIRTCKNPKHEIREVTAVVCIFTPKRGVVEESVDAFCCPQCKRYYILEKNFDRLQRKGKLCCRVITRQGTISEFVTKPSDELGDQSFYNSMGYNVNQKEDLSPGERRAILDFIIVNDFRTQKQAIGYLQWLIRRNGRNRNMGNAVRRWESDIDYLMKRKKSDVKRVKIDRIFLTKHKWR